MKHELPFKHLPWTVQSAREKMMMENVDETLKNTANGNFNSGSQTRRAVGAWSGDVATSQGFDVMRARRLQGS